MANKSRPLDDRDVIHVAMVGATGQLAQMDTPVSLAELAEYIMAKLPVKINNGDKR